MITEQKLEDTAVGWFAELGWPHANGPEIAPDGDQPARTDYRQVVLREHLLAALARINPHIPAAALEQAAHELLTVGEPLLIARNRRVHRLLLSGIPVEFSVGDEKRSDLVNLIDFANPRNNDFLLVSQFTVRATRQPRRPDLVAFVNGLPLVVIELKNPANEQTDIWDALNQIQTYKEEIGDLFNTNVAVVVSDGFTARLGSLTANQGACSPGGRLPTRTTGRCWNSSWKRWCVASSSRRCFSTMCATSFCSSRMPIRSSRRSRAITSSMRCARR